MPWYKFTEETGRGHTSVRTDYFWYDWELTAEQRRDEWDAWASRGHERVTGNVVKLDALPEDVRLDKIAAHKASINRHRRQIRRLERGVG